MNLLREWELLTTRGALSCWGVCKVQYNRPCAFFCLQSGLFSAPVIFWVALLNNANNSDSINFISGWWEQPVSQYGQTRLGVRLPPPLSLPLDSAPGGTVQRQAAVAFLLLACHGWASRRDQNSLAARVSDFTEKMLLEDSTTYP